MGGERKRLSCYGNIFLYPNFFVAVGEFPVELLAYQVSMNCTANYRGILLMDNSYRTKKTLGDRAFENVVPLEIRKCQSLNTFKVLLKTHLFKLAFY